MDAWCSKVASFDRLSLFLRTRKLGMCAVHPEALFKLSKFNFSITDQTLLHNRLVVPLQQAFNLISCGYHRAVTTKWKFSVKLFAVYFSVCLEGHSKFKCFSTFSKSLIQLITIPCFSFFFGSCAWKLLYFNFNFVLRVHYVALLIQMFAERKKKKLFSMMVLISHSFQNNRHGPSVTYSKQRNFRN